MKFKLLITGILSLVIATIASAELVGAPYIPELDKRLNRIEAVEGDVTFSLTNSSSMSSALRSTASSGLGISRVAHAIFVLDGIGISSLSPTSTVTLPAKSLLIGGWYYNSVTIQTSGIDPLIKFQCEDDANIAAAVLPTVTLAAISGTSLGRPYAASVQGTAPKASIAAACPILATVSHGTFSQGQIDLYVEYVITN